jgi:hypothetical protein
MSIRPLRSLWSGYLVCFLSFVQWPNKEKEEEYNFREESYWLILILTWSEKTNNTCWGKVGIQTLLVRETTQVPIWFFVSSAVFSSSTWSSWTTPILLVVVGDPSHKPCELWISASWERLTFPGPLLACRLCLLDLGAWFWFVSNLKRLLEDLNKTTPLDMIESRNANMNLFGLPTPSRLYWFIRFVTLGNMYTMKLKRPCEGYK